MARTRRVPKKIVHYDELGEGSRRRYDGIYRGFEKKTISELREQAVLMGIESPTTLPKSELMKRMTDCLIYDYLSPEEKNDESFEINEISGEKIQGVYGEYNGECRLGRISISPMLAKNLKIRSGDLVEGIVSDFDGKKTLMSMQRLETDSQPGREWFDDIPTCERRKFGTAISGTRAGLLMPELQMGERVIISDMSRDDVRELMSSFEECIGLCCGLEPEHEAFLDKAFLINFDCTEAEMLRIAYLALDRAKRLAERGKDTVLIVYGFDNLCNRDIERALFGAGRCFIKGSLTIIADISMSKEYDIFKKIATRIVEK